MQLGKQSRIRKMRHEFKTGPVMDGAANALAEQFASHAFEAIAEMAQRPQVEFAGEWYKRSLASLCAASSYVVKRALWLATHNADATIVTLSRELAMAQSLVLDALSDAEHRSVATAYEAVQRGSKIVLVQYFAQVSDAWALHVARERAKGAQP